VTELRNTKEPCATAPILILNTSKKCSFETLTTANYTEYSKSCTFLVAYVSK